MSKRTRLSPQARRTQLIDLGVEMLATRRLDELSVELIAKAAGISRGLLFHYFPTKQDFHLEVARAAADEMLRRTEADTDLSPVDALRGALTSFLEYVEENPDNYKSLVRGAMSGDANMRAIFDSTRAAMAQRVIDVIGGMGIEATPRTALAIHGWVGFVEECVVRWIDVGGIDREELLDMLTKSLPAVALSATDADLGTLASILTADQAIAAT